MNQLNKIFLFTIIILHNKKFLTGEITNLTNYWSFSGDYTDSVGNASLTSGVNYKLGNDRFGTPNSSLDLNIGYMKIPPGVYIGNDFTISMWVNFRTTGSWARLVTFGNGVDDFYFALYGGSSQVCSLIVDSPALQVITPNALKLNTWHFVTYVSLGTKGIIYFNGIQQVNGTQLIVSKISRPCNFIGYSNHGATPYSNAFFDEIKFYSRALSEDEIKNEYLSSIIPPVTTLAPTTTQVSFQTDTSSYFVSSSASISSSLSTSIFNNVSIFNTLSSTSLSDSSHHPSVFFHFDGNLIDEKNPLSLLNGFNYEFTKDRFDNPNAALSLNLGFIQLPPAVYFDGDFTVSLWICFRSFQYMSKIFDFGNGPGLDNVFLGIFETSNELIGQVYNKAFTSDYVSSIKDLKIGKWFHILFVLKGNNASLYINGVLAASTVSLMPANTTRNFNYLGRSNWHHLGDADTDAIIDDFKIYNRALNNDEIKVDFESVSPLLKMKWLYPISNNTILNDDLKYIGCYRDRKRRDLDGFYFDFMDINSPDECVKACGKYNFRYAGVQFEYQCWCGDRFGIYDKAFNCYMNCPSQNKTCGGAWANNVYAVKNISDYNQITVCDSNMLQIQCPANKKINIKYAMYGRVSQSKCRKNSFNFDKCMSNVDETIKILGGICDNKNKCELLIDNKIFGDPCSSHSKYLDVKYDCV